VWPAKCQQRDSVDLWWMEGNLFIVCASRARDAAHVLFIFPGELRRPDFGRVRLSEEGVVTKS
jgi:hypothetical protein